jgi:ATP-dependent helicase HrpA
LFAQELGTVEPVSPVKLDRELKVLQRFAENAGAPAATVPKSGDRPPAPVAIPATTGPLKNLGALDRLFPRT